MYYCKSRYYNPEWCRWLNGDHIAYFSLKNIKNMNLFAYCGNNPINIFDPNGNFWLIVTLAAIGIGLLVTLKSDSQEEPYKSSITEKDVNINGANPKGNIIVEINDSSIQIVDSYRFSETADKERIMEIIIEV